MAVVGKVDSLWRYPVKSMAGEEREEIFVGYAGVHGDRLFAFRNAGAPPKFPYLTGREEKGMLAHRPRFRDPAKAELPADFVVGYPADLSVDVETPTGGCLAIDDPAMLRSLANNVNVGALSLLRSERAMTDSYPVSLFSLQTADQLGEELGEAVDKRRFRANIYMDLASGAGFAEDAFVGRNLRIGPKLVVSIVERDARCKMVTLHPDTGEETPEILRNIAKTHGGTAGIYGAVLKEGAVRQGDAIELLD